MSRLTDKIRKYEEQLSDIEQKLEDLYNKQKRSNFKHSRKQHRKKYTKDINYRMQCYFTRQVEKDLYNMVEGTEFKGLKEIIKK